MSARTQVESNAAPAAVGPYSQAIRSGSLIFTAGQVAMDPGTGELVEGGVAEQADRVLRNLSAVLDAAGSSLERVLKTTVFLADMGDWAAMNEVYAAHFSPPYPARTSIAVKALPKGALIEIECVAVAEDAG